MEGAQEHVRVRSLARAEWEITAGRCGARHHIDAHVRELGDEAVDKTAVQPAANPGMCRLADHDMLHCKLLGDGHHGVGELALALDVSTLEELRELPGLGSAGFGLLVMPAQHSEHCAEPAES